MDSRFSRVLGQALAPDKHLLNTGCRRTCLQLLFVLLVIAYPHLLLAQEPVLTEVRVPKAAPNWVVPQDYYVSLLRQALLAGARGRLLPEIKETLEMEQGRISYELSKGQRLDIAWMGTDLEREKNLRAIHIPLVRGLLGFRRMIIRQDMAAKFVQVKNLQDLQRYSACQGLDWPDAEILRASGLRVVQLAGYRNLFHALAGRRCDYLPRGYYETDLELKQILPIHPELMLFEPLVIHYPFPMYFFTGRQNEYLAQWIEAGLEQMIDNGQLLATITNHPYTSSAFPLTASKNWVWINLPNPILSPGADADNSRYWFQQGDFQSD